MSKVFILTDGGHDYSDASRFGELTYCRVTVKNKYDLAQMFRELRKSFDDSTQEDFLVLSSLASLCCVATAILTELHGRVNFLIFEQGRYIDRTVVLTNDLES